MEIKRDHILTGSFCALGCHKTSNSRGKCTFFAWMAFPAGIYSYEYISRDILTELKKANWTSFVLGIVRVGLEVGFIYAYKAGWKVSAAQIVTSSILGVILIIVGYVGYKEAITWNKIVGVIVCLAGLGLINLK